MPVDGGRISKVRYAEMMENRTLLKIYLAALSSVSNRAFDTFGRPQKMAFLINAYNAFTIELILTRYPNLKSIKELGSWFSSPWTQKWVPLFETNVSLDDIEHEMLRKPGHYDEPRIHFAVNCASIGCPALREEAFVPERLDAQLHEQTMRFMSDRTRNRFNSQLGRLEVSNIFKWFEEDFRQGHQGITSLRAFMAKYADQLADAPAERERIQGQELEVAFLDYDWTLNDASP